MKNSIKTLTILLVSILVSNVAKAAVYSVSYSGNTATWKNSSGSTISAPNLTVNDDITVTAGTWTISTSRKAKSITLDGGTITLSGNNSSLTSNSSGNTTYPPLLVKKNATVTSNRRLGAITIQAGTLTMGSDFSASSVALTGGSLDVSTYDLNGSIAASVSGTISGSGTLQDITISGGTLTAGSNLDINNLTMSGGDLYLSNFIVTTGGDVTISANGKISSSGSGILFNDGNRTTINGGTLTIDSAELITEDLTFSSNHFIVTTHSGLMSFDNNNSTTISGANANRHVNGTIRVYMDNSSKDAEIYPIGDGSFYAPIELDPNGKNISNTTLSSVTNYGTHYIDISYVGAKNSNTAIDTSLKSASGSEYWNISTSSTNPAATFKLFVNSTGTTYGQTTVSGTDITTALELALYNSSTNKWVKVPAAVATVTGGYSVTTSAVIAPNTPLTFGSTSTTTTFLTPLPVSIIDFSAKAKDNNVEIKWSTASEKDNAAFVVEKSIDGQVWSAIGTVKGAKTSNIVNNYGLVDFKAVAGVQYYRLKQIDEDGTVNYSKAIAVNFSKASTLSVNLFPNPAKDALNIATEKNTSGEVNIQILNSMGEAVYSQVVEAGLVQTIDIASFIPGVYCVTVIAESEIKELITEKR